MWRDTSSIEAGRDWDGAIEAALDAAYALLVVLSEKSLTSDWVKRETQFARRKSTPIVCAQVDLCEIPYVFSQNEVANFSRIHRAEGFEQVGFYRQALRQLVTALDETRPALIYLRQLKDPDDAIREKAATKLGDLGDRGATEPLIEVLSDQDEGVRFAAAEASLTNLLAVHP